MDNPQYYQPLSHALDPPRSTQYPSARTYSSEHTATTSNPQPEQSEHDESDDDEGLVEEQLAHNESDPASPQPKSSSVSENQPSQPTQIQSVQQENETKRRPGRPRGSKNRRGRPSIVQQQAPTKPVYETPSHPPLHPTGKGTNPPQLPEVNEQNQGYYEFQWRVLNLCTEFYGAAEQLVKATPPLVIAQCYPSTPGHKFDPLVMLNEAKQNCDALLANPSKLIANPPPPINSPTSFVYTTPVQPAATAAPGTAASSSKPPTVINQPQSFVVSMGTPVHYSVYPPPTYPSTPYYQYPFGQPYYPPATSTAPAPASATTSSTAVPTPSPTVPTPVSGIGNQGVWSDEEVERLRKLSADARATGLVGDAEWDWVANQWGAGRTKRQILLKASQLGLKEGAPPRGVKRRRENDGKEDGPGPSTAPTPSSAPASTAPVNPTTSTASPAQTQATNTPTQSPSVQHQSRPLASKPSSSVSVAPATVTTMPWPMPTVAASTVSPVLGSTTTSEHRTTSYYRPRPSDPSTKSYLYQPNGRTQETGK